MSNKPLWSEAPSWANLLLKRTSNGQLYWGEALALGARAERWLTDDKRPDKFITVVGLEVLEERPSPKFDWDKAPSWARMVLRGKNTGYNLWAEGHLEGAKIQYFDKPEQLSIQDLDNYELIESKPEQVEQQETRYALDTLWEEVLHHAEEFKRQGVKNPGDRARIAAYWALPPEHRTDYMWPQGYPKPLLHRDITRRHNLLHACALILLELQEEDVKEREAAEKFDWQVGDVLRYVGDSCPGLEHGALCDIRDVVEITKSFSVACNGRDLETFFYWAAVKDFLFIARPEAP